MRPDCPSGLPPFQGRLIGYARVSTDDQNPELQLDALSAIGCDPIFQDYITGVDYDRPGLADALAALQPGDIFTVWALDRLGRTMLEILNIVIGDIHRKGIGFHSLTETYDLETPIGRGILAIRAAVAEDEYEKNRRRTVAGMKSARARGIAVGRPQKLTQKQIIHARDILRAGDRKACELAAELGVSPVTLARALRRLESCS